MRRFDIHSILAPLAVMLMLTVVVGYTAYQMTVHWEASLQESSGRLVRAQILNNIQWQLRQVDLAQQEGNDDEAKRIWADVQEQVGYLDNENSLLGVPQSLEYFVNDEKNRQRIPIILKERYFHYNLNQLQDSMTELQRNARRVTLMITVSMAVLGLLLMGITAWDLTRLFGSLAKSRDLNNKIQEDERKRISQELHDAVIQELIDLKRDYHPNKVDRLVASIRRICHNLKPQVLEDLGVSAALDLLADDLRQRGLEKVQINVDETHLATLPHSYELPLFRIVQELFNNIKQHAEATQVTLNLIYDPQESPMLRLYVRDNGKGFDPKSAPRGLGLTGVEERLKQLNGQLSIKSSPSTGSFFQILIPIQQRRKSDGNR